VIESFSNRLAEDLYDDQRSKTVLRLPPDLVRVARRRLLYFHDASELGDLREPPGNRLEALKREWTGFHSIRIKEQCRLVIHQHSGNAYEVQL
jgi:proteic killer suppression protein